jgi:hypothetical protein
MKEHTIITKLRRPLENFTAHDLAELIQAYDEVRAECNRVKEDVALALRQPYWMNPREEWECPKCGKLNYGTAALCECQPTVENLEKRIHNLEKYKDIVDTLCALVTEIVKNK